MSSKETTEVPGGHNMKLTLDIQELLMKIKKKGLMYF